MSILAAAPHVQAACESYDAAEYGCMVLLTRGDRRLCVNANDKAADALIERMRADGWTVDYVPEIGPY